MCGVDSSQSSIRPAELLRTWSVHLQLSKMAENFVDCPRNYRVMTTLLQLNSNSISTEDLAGKWQSIEMK